MLFASIRGDISNCMVFFTKQIKKHKCVRKRTKGRDIENYASRILMIDDAREETNRFAKKKKNKQTRFQNKKRNNS